MQYLCNISYDQNVYVCVYVDPSYFIGICVPVNNTLSLRCSDVYMLHAMILCENVVISPVLF